MKRHNQKQPEIRNTLFFLVNERDFEDDYSDYGEDEFKMDEDFIDYEDLEDEEKDGETEEPAWEEMEDDEIKESDLDDFEKLDDDGDQEGDRWLDYD